MKSYTLFAVTLIFLITGCSFGPETERFKKIHVPASEPQSYSWEKGEFRDYVHETRNYVRKERVFFNPQNIKLEVDANSPFEIKPDPNFCGKAERGKKGVLLIHGLGDSPFSMRDLAESYSRSCYLVRTILLNGHGTKPADSLNATAEDWYRTARFALETLKRDVQEVYVGGFSTGANISTTLAFQDPSIKGLVLYSPAYSLSGEYETLVSMAGWFTDWLLKSSLEDYTKYTSSSVNSVLQFYVTSKNVRQSLEKGKKLKIPVFIALSENDTAVNVDYIRQTFYNHFIHPGNQMIYFKQNGEGMCDPLDQRIICYNSYLPEQKIAAFSHMALPIKPENFHYGKNGDYRNCQVSPSLFQPEKDFEICRKAMKSEIWYSPWGFEEEGKIFSRLTYNPYFDVMMKYSLETLATGELKAQNTAMTDQLKN